VQNLESLLADVTPGAFTTTVGKPIEKQDSGDDRDDQTDDTREQVDTEPCGPDEKPTGKRRKKDKRGEDQPRPGEPSEQIVPEWMCANT
jgi:hypothetical protein